MRVDGVRRSLVLLGLVLTLTGCTTAGSGEHDGPEPERLRVQVLEERPHDPGAFTQGLELVDGVLYEGTGLLGQSSIRAVDPVTGQVRHRVELPASLFGEGITVVGDRIWQLTWQQGVALERDRNTLAELRRVPYEGEGWGLCYDGPPNAPNGSGQLVMSDGSATLTLRDPVTFQPTGRVVVRRAGEEVERLNELECTGGTVWANVWQTDEIVRIDLATGHVTAVVDASGLLGWRDRIAADVLNGIAAVPGTDEFLVTGKNWPRLFRVRFTPEE
ncbi:MAG TPA: glutaminyl-peptide cyclotransferase [Pseudonocardiaceae bacterium]